MRVRVADGIEVAADATSHAARRNIYDEVPTQTRLVLGECLDYRAIARGRLFLDDEPRAGTRGADDYRPVDTGEAARSPKPETVAATTVQDWLRATLDPLEQLDCGFFGHR